MTASKKSDMASYW